MKNKILCMLLILCIFTTLFTGTTVTASSVADGTCGEDLTWVLDSDGVLTVTGTGTISEKSWTDYISSITSIVINEGVTGIDSVMFSGLNKVTSISLPSTLKSIGESALGGLGVETLIIPDSVETLGTGAFRMCHSLKSVILPKNLKEIPIDLLSNCEKLETVVIPDGVTTINAHPFDSCDRLTVIVLPKSVTKVASTLFCMYPSNLYYTGTKQEFEAIEGVFVNAYSNITVHYNFDMTGPIPTPAPIPTFAPIITATPTPTTKPTATPKPAATIKPTATPSMHTPLPIPTGTTTMEPWPTATPKPTLRPEPNITAPPVMNNHIATGICGVNLVWTLDKNGTLTVSGSGDMYDYNTYFLKYDTTIPWYKYYDKITAVIINGGVTSVGNSAFTKCYSLETASLPEGLITIGEYAFNKCKALHTVNIPSTTETIGEDAFNECGAITEITIPDGVTTIGESAFERCRSLGSITLPESVMNIESYAFLACTSLKTAVINSELTSIPSSMFGYCENLENVNIPTTVTFIGDGAFAHCKKLKNINLPDGLTDLSSSVFSSTDITEIIIPEGVRVINRYAFSNCPSLTTVYLPISVIAIDEYAFSNCDKLTDIYYNGTSRDWYHIIKYNGSEHYSNATIHCTKGSVTDSFYQLTVTTDVEDYIKNGDTVVASVSLNTTEGLSGYQFVLKFDPEAFEIDTQNDAYINTEWKTEFAKYNNWSVVKDYAFFANETNGKISNVSLNTIGTGAITKENALIDTVIMSVNLKVKDIEKAKGSEISILTDETLVFATNIEGEETPDVFSTIIPGNASSGTEVCVNGKTVLFSTSVLPIDAVILVTMYDNSGIFIGARCYTAEEYINANLDFDDSVAYTKIMLWNDMTSIQPMENAQDIEF